MTDAAFCFQEDVKTRSKIKQGAFHKKNGSKSKKCTLPSDYMTEGQKKKMNGECYSLKMNEPIYDWKSFRKLSENLQAEYINGLVTNYEARGSDIAQMFNISRPTLYVVCKNYSTPITFSRTANRNMSMKFMDFLTTPKGFTEEEETTPEPAKEVEPDQTDISEPEIPQVENSEKGFNYAMLDDFRFRGKGQKTDILELIERMLGDGIEYNFWVDFDEKLETLLEKAFSEEGMSAQEREASSIEDRYLYNLIRMRVNALRLNHYSEKLDVLKHIKQRMEATIEDVNSEDKGS